MRQQQYTAFRRRTSARFQNCRLCRPGFPGLPLEFGELVSKQHSLAVGAIVFRGLIALALRVGLSPIDLKLATAAFVLLTLALPTFGFGRRTEVAR